MGTGGLAVALLALGVDHSKFRTCETTSFCKRNRTPQQQSRRYLVAPNSVNLDQNGQIHAQLHGGPYAKPLNLNIRAYASGVVRMRILEENPMRHRWEPDDILLEQDPANLERLQADSEALPSLLKPQVQNGEVITFKLAEASDNSVVALFINPFRVQLFVSGKVAVDLNPSGRLYFEHYRAKDASLSAAAQDDDSDEHQGKTVVDYGEDGLAIYSDGTKQAAKAGRFAEKTDGAEPAEDTKMTDDAQDGLWEESFGSHKDSKPFGPSSVGMDITFDGAHLYGLAEHTAPLNLPSTTGQDARYKDPYRMYTLDVYDYELDSPMALYGGVPLVLSNNADRTVGLLWFNPTETFVDISRNTSPGGWFSAEKKANATTAYWMSESGVIDIMLLPGPNPKAVFGQYAKLTGSTPLPPLFSLGYHQCRWNYNDEADVDFVHNQFEELDFPFDVLWLDIEHTDGKRYFTWDSFKFPKPKEMQEKLAATGRKMVTIIDPHIKKDENYAIYKEAHEKGLFIKKPDGETEFDGWCWPGASAYLDFTSPEVREWWAGRFAYDKYVGSTPTLYTWNDMNEPSVFNGPEVSMQKDAKSLAGIEHREWHNLYGMYMHRATAEGQMAREAEGEKKRPFVLSRSFYAGSQRWGPIWTGDNACKWDHLAMSVPMLLSLSVCGIAFSGADVGGFLGKGGGYGDPDAELFTRWFEAGAYTPFFRGHAHHDSARREPYTFGMQTTMVLTSIAYARYTLLPYWYTLFYEAEKTGVPPMRPMWVEYPLDEKTWSMDDQYLVGSDLLIKPITTKGATDAEVYFPGDNIWYSVHTHDRFKPKTTAEVSASMGSMPVFQRGGSILPRKMRLRRSSMLMKNDPYTLHVAPSTKGEAEGLLYMDDEDGFQYREGKFALRKFTLARKELRCTTVGGSLQPMNKIERIVIFNLKLSKAMLHYKGEKTELTVTWDSTAKSSTIRKPDIPAADDWSITYS